MIIDQGLGEEEEEEEGDAGIPFQLNNPSTRYIRDEDIRDNKYLELWEVPKLPALFSEVSSSRTRATLPGFSTVVPEVQMDKDLCIHFGLTTSKVLWQNISYKQRPEKMRDNYKGKVIEFGEPVLESFIVEQDLQSDLDPVVWDEGFVGYSKAHWKRRKAIQKRRITILQSSSHHGLTFEYAPVEESLYPRRADGPGRIETIPMFQFPERDIDLADIIYKDGHVILSPDLSQKMLKHCVLYIDYNDYLLNKTCHFTQGTEDMFFPGEVSFGRKLIMDHFKSGRWVWITKRTDVSRRSIMIELSGDLYDAQLMYYLGKDQHQVPERVKPLERFCRTRHRPLDAWERRQNELMFGLMPIAGRLDSGARTQGYYRGDAGALGWANLGDNNNLATILRPENHGLHTWAKALSLGKKEDFFPNRPDLVKRDSGYSSDTTPSSSIDGFPPPEGFSHHLHEPGCNNEKTPGLACACAGPSRWPGQEVYDGASGYAKSTKSTNSIKSIKSDQPRVRKTSIESIKEGFQKFKSLGSNILRLKPSKGKMKGIFKKES
ncbi:hypothetical protein NHQ30_003220 [Ciborinia camelliae]|nr:hypothetical protein NHQ30_003220 [Ciborinia camelliae]